MTLITARGRRPRRSTRRWSPAVPVLPDLTSRRAARLFADDTGAATAEYAIATMAAVVRLGQT